jgi:nucleotide-binding universal stress UspA family protein
MYKRILVAPDGSQLLESILPYARSFAKTVETPVELEVVLAGFLRV